MIDRHSATWREIAAWTEGALSKARERIETPGISPEETERLRGQILTLRLLLGMPDGPPERVIETAEDYGFQSADDA